MMSISQHFKLSRAADRGTADGPSSKAGQVLLGAVLVLVSHIASAGGGYYECTKPNGTLEFTLYPCEEGDEQERIGGQQQPVKPETRKRRQSNPVADAVPLAPPEPPEAGKEYNRASYKCIGKAGDILYTDARDYLAFEVYKCSQMPRWAACAEAIEMKAKNPLAIISNKLNCI